MVSDPLPRTHKQICSHALDARCRYPKPDFQALRYHSVPKTKPSAESLDDIDPAMRQAWDKLGIPLGEQKRLGNVKPPVAMDYVWDSKSILTRSVPISHSPKPAHPKLNI